MRYFNLLLSLLAVVGLLLTGCENPNGIEGPDANASASLQPIAGSLFHTADNPYVSDLIAGQHLKVGVVKVWNDDAYLYVKYEITEADWCLTETHLEVSETLEGIPQKNGNPAPGQFTYKDDHECVTEFLYEIPNNWECDQELYVAAHAVVCRIVGYEVSLDDFNASLPSSVNLVHQFPGGDSYFNTTVTNGGDLDGTYDGFCIDTDRTISPGATYTATVISSYDPGFATSGLVEFPENMDLVNWIINQGFVGQTSPGGYGTYTYGDVQRAIWTLIEDVNSTSGLGSWNQNRVDEIVAAAQASGDGFVPGCGQSVAVILNPVNVDGTTTNQITIAQVTFIDVSVPCTPVYQCETAWGAGFDFPGKNWATYFTYTIQCDGNGGGNGGCETAFAYGAGDATCFDQYGFSRWGWTNGAIGAGSYSYDVYAGAGQCDLNKGTDVGTLTIDYDGSTATVTYTMDAGYVMEEVHLYIGNGEFPLDKKGNPTVAPGLYPYSADLDNATTYTFEVPASGEIYVIAHAVVCEATP